MNNKINDEEVKKEFCIFLTTSYYKMDFKISQAKDNKLIKQSSIGSDNEKVILAVLLLIRKRKTR